MFSRLTSCSNNKKKRKVAPSVLYQTKLHQDGRPPCRCCCSQCEHSPGAPLLLKHLLFPRLGNNIEDAARSSFSYCVLVRFLVLGKEGCRYCIIAAAATQQQKKSSHRFSQEEFGVSVVANFWTFLLFAAPLVLSTFFCPCCSVSTAPV